MAFQTEEMASPEPDFECKGAANVKELNTKGFTLGEFISRVSDDRVALNGNPDPDEILANVAASGEGTGYKSKDFYFFQSSGGDHALIVEATGQRISCVGVSAYAKQFDPKPTLAMGKALETIIRAKPDVSGNRVEKLPFGEPLSILKNAGNSYQGYPWFEVEYGEYQTGFAWGGTLCSEGKDIEGTSARCENIN